MVETDSSGLAEMGLVLRELTRGGWIVVADAANRFNPYALAASLRSHGLDRSVLRRVLVSRCFTCHQLEALVRDRLDQVARHWGASLALVSGVGALLYDPEVPASEAFRVGRSIVRSLLRPERLATIVTLSPPPPARAALHALFRSRALTAGRVLASSFPTPPTRSSQLPPASSPSTEALPPTRGEPYDTLLDLKPSRWTVQRQPPPRVHFDGERSLGPHPD